MIKIINSILPKENHYYVAVSMGLDSVAALLWLRSKEYKVTPIHFNHNLRAQNGTMHEKFIALCRFLNLEGKSEIGIDLKTEEDCRNARLRFYSKFAQGGTVITAHHLNDWVESYLMNCFRGHPNHRPFELVSNFDNFKIIHPFLLTKKKDFKQFLDRNSWTEYVVEDETNPIVKGSRRNWVRNVILPELDSKQISLEKFAMRRINKQTNRKISK